MDMDGTLVRTDGTPLQFKSWNLNMKNLEEKNPQHSIFILNISGS